MRPCKNEFSEIQKEIIRDLVRKSHETLQKRIQRIQKEMIRDLVKKSHETL